MSYKLHRCRAVCTAHTYIHTYTKWVLPKVPQRSKSHLWSHWSASLHSLGSFCNNESVGNAFMLVRVAFNSVVYYRLSVETPPCVMMDNLSNEKTASEATYV